MVYNLTALMLDSGIKDVHNEGLSKLFDKFSIMNKHKNIFYYDGPFPNGDSSYRI